MNHNTLQNYYDVVLSLIAQRQRLTLTEIENMIPFERDIYCMGIEHYNKSREQR